MPQGYCRFCNRLTELRKSHAIPRSFLRDMLRQDSGKMVHLSTGDEPARRLGDTSHDYLLCHECEQAFGNELDRPIKEFFIRIRRDYRVGQTHLTLANGATIKNAISSVLWRSAISKAKFYDGFNPKPSVVRALRGDILKLNEFSFSYRVQPIFDPNTTSVGGFDSDVIDAFLLSPKVWGAKFGFRGRQKTRIGIIFIAGGVLVEVVERRSKSSERQRGYILDGKCDISLQAVSLWTIPAVEELLRWSVLKENNPHITINSGSTGS